MSGWYGGRGAQGVVRGSVHRTEGGESVAQFAGVALATLAFCAVAVWQTSLLWDAVMPWAELIAGDESLFTGGLL